MTLTQSEINIFYGHELYARLMSREACGCEECAEIRPKIFKRVWKSVKASARSEKTTI